MPPVAPPVATHAPIPILLSDDNLTTGVSPRSRFCKVFRLRSVERQRDLLSRLRGAQRGGEHLLDVAADLGCAELSDLAALAHARQKVRRTVALVRPERRPLDEATALRADDLYASHAGALALVRGPGLVHDQRPALAVYDHRERRLATDLRPAGFEQTERGRIRQHD